MTTHRVELLSRRLLDDSIHWREWSAAPFAEARASRKPVVLFLTTSWAAGCAEMDRTVFVDPSIVSLIRNEWVAVRVDADRRPDVNERYNLGGWPTTALLTPDGDMLFGGTFFEASELASALRRALDAFAAAPVRQPLPSSPQPRDPGGDPGIDADADDWLVEHLLSEADPTYGGFGQGSKHPAAAALALLLARYRERADSSVGEVLVQSLDAICAHLYDRGEGGFFRCAENRDWSDVRREKLAADNAALIPICLQAATLLNRPLYRACAMETLSWVRNSMADIEHGGFFASVRYADGRDLPSNTHEETSGSPTVDRTLFADANAAMSSAWMIASDTLGDSSLMEFALMSLERVVLELYRPGAGLAHYQASGPGARGWLFDQVRAASALVTAARLTGREPYVMLAEELMQYARRSLWDDDSGGFFDRKPPVVDEGDIGLLAVRIKPLEANCEAARTLISLAALSERPEYREWAALALASQTPVYRTDGVQGAVYGLAALEFAGAMEDRQSLS